MRFHPLIIVLVLVVAGAVGCRRPAADLPAAVATIRTQPIASKANHPTVEADSREPETITWDELDVDIHAESHYEPWMMKTSIRSLDEQPVRITGYMHGGVAVKEGIREFILLRNIDCPYGRQGEAHHVIVVRLADDLRTSYSQKALTVEGTFHIRPFDGPDGATWSLYELDNARLSRSDESTTEPVPIH
jgi:hypothetical protein